MMEYTMSMYRSKDDMLAAMRDEITQLRAEIEQERELGDRLAREMEKLACRQNWDGYDWVGTGFTGRHIAMAALADHATRRNK